MELMEPPVLLKPGQHVFWRNLKRNFESREAFDCFQALTKEQAKALKNGDLVFVNCEPYAKSNLRGVTLLEVVSTTSELIRFKDHETPIAHYRDLFRVKPGKEDLLKKLMENPLLTTFE